MAKLEERRPENAAGDFYVDASCIDCDTCRWMAPETFSRSGEQSAVHRQPAGDEERERALMALVSCPTSSIGTVEKHAMAGALARLPEEIEDGVYCCGYHAEASYGATSYLVVRPEGAGGNVLVDSPRFAGPLVKRIEELGGVRTMFLTHRDDVADHERFRARFGCERVLHIRDAVGALRGVERVVEGLAPVALDDELTVIPTPGHTKGSACLLYRGRYLFSGDHLAWSATRERLSAFRHVNWYDWPTQVESMRRLAEHDFEWILPGHGRRVRLERPEMRRRLRELIARMETA